MVKGKTVDQVFRQCPQQPAQRKDANRKQRPLQIGATGQSDWSLSGQRSFRLTPQSISKPAG